MFLKNIQVVDWPDNTSDYPFNLSALQGLEEIQFDKAITYFVGENGSGKSSVLEAIAVSAGFNSEGGSRHNVFSTVDTGPSLADHFHLSWWPKVTNGFFLRAESFFNFSTYIDNIARDSPEESRVYASYGGRSLHQQSHGESFLSLFTHRFRHKNKALYLLDEPEAALTPMRQLALLRILWDHEQSGRSQFIMATHSPILLAYPGADILSFDSSPLRSVSYEQTDHYIITKEFLLHRDRMLQELFKS